MNKFCVVARNFETYFIQRLISEVGQSRVEFIDPWKDRQVPQATKLLVRSTSIYGDDRDLDYLKSMPLSKRVINPLSVLERFRSKPLQYEWMEKQGLPLLPWRRLKGEPSSTVKLFFEDRIISQAIVKPYRGQGGWGVQKLDCETCSHWWESRREQNDEEYLLQAFVDAEEYRYFFIQGQSWVLKRQGKELAANFSVGGSATLSELPEVAKPIILQLVIKSGAHYGAIDFFVAGKNVWILELNTCPGIEQLEQVTQQNIISHLLKSF